jgi:hypothetical protein
MMRSLWLVLVLVLAACPRERVSSKGCLEDKDCGSPTSAFRCEPTTGECYCRTDAACPGAQFCNGAGFCQDRAGCEKNVDCLNPTLYCDTGTGQCVPKGRCASDLQCSLGEVCDLKKGQCVAGCRRNGDCPGTSCRCGDVACACTGTTPEELARCTLGVCDPNFCADDSFCRFGEVCSVIPDAGNPRPQCHSDFDIDQRPYCARCTSGGGVDTCGTGANFCIIDTRLASTYCGADCSEGQSCPRGYGCRDIRVVFTRWQCSATQPCPGDPTLPCATDSECKRGGSCIKSNGSSTGFCAGQCRIREGSSFGYCSCQIDADCPLETCSMGECSISRRKCITDDQCRTIRCVDFDGVGGCLIGQNCTPTNGLTCVEVQ